MNLNIIKNVPYLYIYAYIFIVNIYGFIIMGMDKKKSLKRKWRTREKAFFITAFIGGALGIYMGMKVYHHKTLHKKFKYGIPAIILLNLAILIFIFYI